MANEKTFKIIGRDASVSEIFQRKGYKELTNGPVKPDTLIVFLGGEDVTPALYGEDRHPTTGNNERRDLKELWEFHQYLKNPKVGICRGGQFLNVASGGAMWQNVDNHAIFGTHDLRDIETGELVKVTSTHHQMMRPALDAIWIADATESKKLEGYNEVIFQNSPDLGENIFGDDEDVWDCEVIFYDRTQSLCFQPHPEYGVRPCEEYFFRCIDRVFG